MKECTACHSIVAHTNSSDNLCDFCHYSYAGAITTVDPDNKTVVQVIAQSYNKLVREIIQSREVILQDLKELRNKISQLEN